MGLRQGKRFPFRDFFFKHSQVKADMITSVICPRQRSRLLKQNKPIKLENYRLLCNQSPPTVKRCQSWFLQRAFITFNTKFRLNGQIEEGLLASSIKRADKYKNKSRETHEKEVNLIPAILYICTNNFIKVCYFGPSYQLNPVF